MVVVIGIIAFAVLVAIAWVNFQIPEKKVILVISGLVQVLLASFVFAIFISFEKKNAFLNTGGKVSSFTKEEVIFGIVVAALLFLDLIFGFILCLKRTSYILTSLVVFIGMAYSYICVVMGVLGIFMSKNNFFERSLEAIELPIREFSSGNSVLFNILMASTFVIPYIIAFIVWSISNKRLKSSDYVFAKWNLYFPFFVILLLVQIVLFFFGVYIFGSRKDDD